VVGFVVRLEQVRGFYDRGPNWIEGRLARSFSKSSMNPVDTETFLCYAQFMKIKDQLEAATDIRKNIVAEMNRKGMTEAQLSRAVGVRQSSLHRTLNSKASRAEKVLINCLAALADFGN
jgi:lambda repressor-like predicted transcriptional regulator